MSKSTKTKTSKKKVVVDDDDTGAEQTKVTVERAKQAFRYTEPKKPYEFKKDLTSIRDTLKSAFTFLRDDSDKKFTVSVAKEAADEVVKAIEILMKMAVRNPKLLGSYKIGIEKDALEKLESEFNAVVLERDGGRKKFLNSTSGRSLASNVIGTWANHTLNSLESRKAIASVTEDEERAVDEVSFLSLAAAQPLKCKYYPAKILQHFNEIQKLYDALTPNKETKDVLTRFLGESGAKRYGHEMHILTGIVKSQQIRESDFRRENRPGLAYGEQDENGNIVADVIPLTKDVMEHLLNSCFKMSVALGDIVVHVTKPDPDKNQVGKKTTRVAADSEFGKLIAFAETHRQTFSKVTVKRDKDSDKMVEEPWIQTSDKATNRLREGRYEFEQVNLHRVLEPKLRIEDFSVERKKNGTYVNQTIKFTPEEKQEITPVAYPHFLARPSELLGINAALAAMKKKGKAEGNDGESGSSGKKKETVLDAVLDELSKMKEYVDLRGPTKAFITRNIGDPHASRRMLITNIGNLLRPYTVNVQKTCMTIAAIRLLHMISLGTVSSRSNATKDVKKIFKYSSKK